MVTVGHRLVDWLPRLKHRERVRDGHVVAFLGRKVPPVGNDLRGQVRGLGPAFVVQDEHASLRGRMDKQTKSLWLV